MHFVHVKAADVLAETIHDGLGGHWAIDDALIDNQQGRVVGTADRSELTSSTARPAPLTAMPEASDRAAADQPEVVHHPFGVLGGFIPMEDLHPEAQR